MTIMRMDGVCMYIAPITALFTESIHLYHIIAAASVSELRTHHRLTAVTFVYLRQNTTVCKAAVVVVPGGSCSTNQKGAVSPGQRQIHKCLWRG